MSWESGIGYGNRNTESEIIMNKLNIWDIRIFMFIDISLKLGASFKKGFMEEVCMIVSFFVWLSFIHCFNIFLCLCLFLLLSYCMYVWMRAPRKTLTFKNNHSKEVASDLALKSIFPFTSNKFLFIPRIAL